VSDAYRDLLADRDELTAEVERLRDRIDNLQAEVKNWGTLHDVEADAIRIGLIVQHVLEGEGAEWRELTITYALNAADGPYRVRLSQISGEPQKRSSRSCGGLSLEEVLEKLLEKLTGW
jgi:hypothetical protein